jgi:hypothetical protein
MICKIYTLLTAYLSDAIQNSALKSTKIVRIVRAEQEGYDLQWEKLARVCTILFLILQSEDKA